MRLIGVSLSKHHIGHDNGLCVGNNCGYVSLYHLSCVCRTLVPESHVYPEMTCVFLYYWCGPRARLSSVMTPEQQGPELLAVCCEDCLQRQVGKCGDTWCKWIEPTESVKPCWPGNLPLHLCEMTDWHHWLTVLFCDIHVNIGMTLNLQLQCPHVSCWAIQCRYITGTAGSYRIQKSVYCHNKFL